MQRQKHRRIDHYDLSSRSDLSAVCVIGCKPSLWPLCTAAEDKFAPLYLGAQNFLASGALPLAGLRSAERTH